MKRVRCPGRSVESAGLFNVAAGGLKFVCSVLLLWSFTAPVARAGVLLSTLSDGTPETYTGDPDLADTFTTGAAALSITGIDVRWAVGYGGTSNRVGIFTDASGSPSSTQVGTWFTSGTPTTATIISYTGSALLSANTNYHLVIDIVDNSDPYNRADSGFFADPSTLGASNPFGAAYGDIQSGWYAPDPFNLSWQLNGSALSSAVPEPTTNVIVGLGALVTAVWKRRKTTTGQCVQVAG
jgi:hypothetical protein